MLHVPWRAPYAISTGFGLDLELRGQFFSQLLGGGDRSAVLFSTYAIKYAVIR